MINCDFLFAFFPSQLKEEALQRELHFMRLALLKNNSCQCSGNTKDKNVASNQSDEMVRQISFPCSFTDEIYRLSNSIRWLIATRKIQTARGKLSMIVIRRFPFCGCQTMRFHDVKRVKSNFGSGDGNTTADPVVWYSAATAASILRPFPKKASWSLCGCVGCVFRASDEPYMADTVLKSNV